MSKPPSCRLLEVSVRHQHAIEVAELALNLGRTFGLAVASVGHGVSATSGCPPWLGWQFLVCRRRQRIGGVLAQHPGAPGRTVPIVQCGYAPRLGRSIIHRLELVVGSLIGL